MKPQQCFIEVQHYLWILVNNRPFNHTQYLISLVDCIPTLLKTFYVSRDPNFSNVSSMNLLPPIQYSQQSVCLPTCITLQLSTREFHLPLLSSHNHAVQVSLQGFTIYVICLAICTNPYARGICSRMSRFQTRHGIQKTIMSWAYNAHDTLQNWMPENWHRFSRSGACHAIWHPCFLAPDSGAGQNTVLFGARIWYQNLIPNYRLLVMGIRNCCATTNRWVQLNH